jgi:general stress protein 26
MPASADQLRELQDLLKHYKTALLTTIGADGHFHTRPMALQCKDLSQGIWFATSLTSAKVHELQSNPHCAIAFHEREHDSTYVSVSGNAELVKDRAVIHEMWDASWKPWFPDGPDQPDLVLIKVMPEHAEFVHTPSGRLQVLFTMAKRLLTKSRDEPAPKHEIDLPH